MYDFCLTLPYGVLLALGGVVGFLSSGSTVSLAAGGGAGAFLTFVGYCSYNEYMQTAATSKLWSAVSLAVSAPLTVVMANRYNKTEAFYPAGLACASSALMSIFYVWVVTKKPKHSPSKKL